MPQKVVTRFAPSPTGLLHGGNYRTAVFAYLFARKMQGEFIVRIEDTDKERSKPEYEDNIHETLSWLALLPERNYRQSGNAVRHREQLEQLIKSGAAFVSQETEGERKEVIRFKNPKTTITFTDAIRGEITFNTSDLGDFVIARSLDEPVFHFAVVVDDYDEGVTHVIRGEDHISNTPRQILIQQALGYETPIYAHLPLVLGPDRAKLSKRRGAKALTQYRNEGYVAEAMINYLALLGWHPEGNKELFTMDELVGEFTLERIQKGAGIFDEEKLRWFNHEHLKRMTDDAYASRVRDFAKKDIDPRIVPLLKERAATLQEAADMLDTEFGFLQGVSCEPALLTNKGKIAPAVASKHLNALAELLHDTPNEGLTSQGYKDLIWPYATAEGRGDVLWPLRTALSGRERSPDPFTILTLVGKDEALARIARAAQSL